MTPDLTRLVSVARGDESADLILADARVVNVFTGEIIRADVAVAGGFIAAVGDYNNAETIKNLNGAFVVPGLIDAHMHMESSMLPPPQFVRLAVPHGTTSVIIDPHEIANVLGSAGVRFMIEASQGLPLGVHVAVPSCVPATDMETAGAALAADDIADLMKLDEVVSLGEMMNFPGVVFAVPDVINKVKVGLSKRVDGHCPGLTGKHLQAYISAGISNDHESTTLEEAREKLRSGLKVFVREGTAAKNLEALLPLLTPENKHRFCFCTDDRHPRDIQTEGHIDHIIRKAVKLGLDPVIAVQVASHFPAVHFGLARKGAVAAGYRADILVVDDLREFNIKQVYNAGRLVAENGEYLGGSGTDDIRPPVNTVHLPKSLSESSFVVKCPENAGKIRVIGMQLHQLTTTELIEKPTVADGCIVADVRRDILKLAVIERHKATGNIGLGFIHGFGIKHGALGSTVGHDSHNMTIIGTNDSDMLLAARALAEAGGGQVVVKDGEVLAIMPLPIAGLMSDAPAETLIQQQTELYRAYRSLESDVDDPFMTLSFMPLAVIPKLKLTDRGLVDVEKFDFVPLAAGDAH